MGWSPASKVGDTDPLIPDAKRKLNANSYGKDIAGDRSNEYTAAFGKALVQYGANVHSAVLKGTRGAPDVNDDGVFDWAIKKQMGLLAPPVPVRKPRIPVYCFRGTGGVIGLDPCSRVCQQLGDLAEEINTPWAATMGGIPVGATDGGIGAPSMWTGIQEGLTAAQNDFLGRRAANPKIRVAVVGYSAGAILAALFIDWLKSNFPDAYIASVSFGDPTRPMGGGFYGRPPAWGRGISTTHYGDPKDYRHAWMAHEDDMYTQVPGGVAGDIMDDVYEEVARFAFTDILTVTMRMIPLIPTVAEKAGISLPAALTSLTAGPIGLFGFGLTTMLGMLPGIVGGGDPNTLTGQAAAGKAMMIALQFLFAGTAPHIRYEFDEAWPGGPTFVQLGGMHLRDYIGRLPAV